MRSMKNSDKEIKFYQFKDISIDKIQGLDS